MPMCGRCKRSHPTLQEVRACFNAPLPKRSAPPVDAISEGDSTEPQRKFVRSLLEQLGREEATLPKPVESYGKREISGVIDSLQDEVRRMPKPVVSQNGNGSDLQIWGSAPDQGRFTVVLDGDSSTQITIRFHTPTSGRFARQPIVQYLYGPDNTSDFRTFGLVYPEGVKIWHQHRANTKLMRGLEYLLGASKEERLSAGETYSLASSNCWRCGRDLTREESITRGMGPICAKKELV